MGDFASVCDLAAKLVDPETRTQAAHDLARQTGAQSLIIYLRDQAAEQLVPIAGMPPSVPPISQSFLHDVTDRHLHSCEHAVGLSYAPDVVLALPGASLPNAAIDDLQQTLPLLTVALRGELRAEQAGQTKREFLATMGHELRTPLNAIGGYVQLLQLGVHGELSAPQLDALDRVHRSQQHLLRLINDILTLARIEAGGMSYEMVNVDLNAMAREVAGTMQLEAGAASLALALELPGREVWVRADREKLEQILHHLISNAIKFTSPGGRLILTTGYERNDERAYIELRDTGHGIPADLLSAIFEAFVQAQSGLTRKHDGSGLGLAISRHLARGMNGEITVESVEGVGSTFRLHLDAAAALRPDRRAPQKAHRA